MFFGFQTKDLILRFQIDCYTNVHFLTGVVQKYLLFVFFQQENFIQLRKVKMDCKKIDVIYLILDCNSRLRAVLLLLLGEEFLLQKLLQVYIFCDIQKTSTQD